MGGIGRERERDCRFSEREWGEIDCIFRETDSGREIGDLEGGSGGERDCRFSGRDWGREIADSLA